MLRQLIHNGVLVPESPSPRHLVLRVRGELVRLTPKQEEMAIAWAKKHGTPYVEDPVFVQNFMEDFSQALGIDPPLSVDEVDFAPAVDVVLREKAAKEALTKEERKALAAERKIQREALKEKYGYAIVDGERVEVGGYVVEPSGIFMGRGQHPLRGRWKEGAGESDIILNLSPDAPRPPGEWKEFVWHPDTLWIARWRDKLSGKLKYIWLSDTAPVKQEREAQKFDQAIELHAELDRVRERIQELLTDPDPKRKMVATACYLIDALCLRVGDEKDEDEEADTVGATTLRPEHVTLYPDGTAEFDFLGKDSVQWNRRIPLSPVVHENLKELIENAQPSNSSNGDEERPQIFPLVTSRTVNDFLSDILPGLTAKVFRTHHATQAVRQVLAEADVVAEDPEYKKWEAATQANLVAAELCNHTKKAPAGWPDRLKRMQEREQRYIERVEQREQQLWERKEKLAALPEELTEKLEGKTEKQRERTKASFAKKIARAQRRVEVAQERLHKARMALGKLRTQMAVNSEKRTWNLGTSLKSYIDPRVYYRWGQEVDYDVLERYYPKALRRKFAWVRNEDSLDDWEKAD